MTTVTRPAPHHRTMSCYKHHGCRQPACIERYNAYQRTRYRRQGYGTWQPFVDAEPVRQHLLTLRAHGISYERVATLTGLPTGTVSGILYTRGDRAPTKRMRADTANRILAIRPRPALVNGRRPIDATGTRRRLQALVAVGFPMLRLGELLPIHPNMVRRCTHADLVHAATARAVTTLYNKLWDQKPTAHGITPGAATKARRYAAKRDWAPPAAWDDELIDAPGAVPDRGTDAPRYIALAEDGLELESQGHTREQAAARLGTSTNNLQKAIERYRRDHSAAETEAAA